MVPTLELVRVASPPSIPLLKWYHIKKWLDDNFVEGCVRLEFTDKNTAKVMDTVGGVMYVEYKNGEVRECQAEKEMWERRKIEA